ncbi:MAG: hypothetical protein WKH68_11720 [Candidatus Limnocylindria bacterium]
MTVAGRIRAVEPPALPREPVLARLSRHLERQGLTPAERLAHVVGLPNATWDRLWRDLARTIDERAARA